MAQMRIFLSHSADDEPFCDAVFQALYSAGADVWYDRHNLRAGPLLDNIMGELESRPVFVVILSKAAFASKWVIRECKWAYNLYDREPNRIILPVVASPIQGSDFNRLLFLEDFRRIEKTNFQPYPEDEAIARTLRLLALPQAEEHPVSVTSSSGDTAKDLLLHGKALAVQEEWDEATVVLEHTTTLIAQPTAEAWTNLVAEAWANLGQASAQSGKYAEALNACNRALELDASSAWVWGIKDFVLRALGHDEDALEAYKQALALDPTYVRLEFSQGDATNEQATNEETPPPASSPLSPSSTHKPTPRLVRRNVSRPASDYVSDQEWEAEQEQVRATWERNRLPKWGLEWEEWDDLLVSPSPAQPDLATDSQSRDDPAVSTNPSVHQFLATYSYKVTDQLRSRTSHSNVRGAELRGKVTPPAVKQTAEMWLHHGDELSANGLTPSSLAAYCHALSFDQSVAMATTTKGMALVALDSLEDALIEFEQSEAQGLQTAISCGFKGNALRALGRFDEALLAYDQALALDPRFIQVWNNKGDVLYMLERPDEALAAYDEALTIQPRYAKALNNKGAVLMQLERFDEAAQVCDRAIAFGLGKIWRWRKEEAMWGWRGNES